MSIEIPKEISEMILRFRAGTLKRPEKMKLFKWFHEMSKVPSFGMKDILREHGYTEKEISRFKMALSRYRKTMTVTARDELKRLENEDFATFIETVWNEAKTIATDVVMAWREKAINMGYYDPDNNTVRMKDFIVDAVNFYIQYKDRVEELEEELEDTKAAGKLAFRLAEPNIAKIYVINSYTRFCAEVLKLASLGIPVPESVILDVKETVNRVISSLKAPLAEGLERYE